jgi:hypothetical protein
MGKAKIKEIAIELEGALNEFDKSASGNKAAAIRFRKHLSRIRYMIDDLRAESKTWSKKKNA